MIRRAVRDFVVIALEYATTPRKQIVKSRILRFLLLNQTGVWRFAPLFRLALLTAAFLLASFAFA